MAKTVSLVQKTHCLNMLKELRHLHNQDLFTDCTIVCRGKQFPAHKLILSCCSNYFKEIFDQTKCCHPILIINEIEPRDFEVLLNYMYEGTAFVSQERLSFLIQEGQAFRIKGFTTNDLNISIQPKVSVPVKSSLSHNSYVSITNETHNSSMAQHSEQTYNSQRHIQPRSSQEVLKLASSDDSSQDSHNENSVVSTDCRMNTKNQNNEFSPIIGLTTAQSKDEFFDTPSEVLSSKSLKIFEQGDVNFLLNSKRQKRVETDTIPIIPYKKSRLESELVCQKSNMYEIPRNDISLDEASQGNDKVICKQELGIEEEEGSTFSTLGLSDVFGDNDNILNVKIENLVDQHSDTFDKEEEQRPSPSEDEDEAKEQETQLQEPTSSSPSCSTMVEFPVNSASGDDFVENLLLSKGLDSCVGVFKEQGITRDIFESLTESFVKELCPKIGQRIKILKLIKEIKQYKNKKRTLDRNDIHEAISKGTVQVIPKDINRDKIISLIRQKNGQLLKKLLNSDYVVDVRDKHAVNRILTDWLCLQTGGYPLAELKLTLAHVICETFPSLRGRNENSCDQWYQPYSTRGKAGGLIEIRVKNWRKNLLDEEKKFIRTSRPSSSSEATEEPFVDQETDKLWLQQYKEPEELVREKMMSTFPVRRRDFQGLKMDDALREWPHMKNGMFINMDYQMMMRDQPHCPDDFLNEFPLKAHKIIELAQKKGKRDEAYDLCLDDLYSDFIINKALFCLPLLLPQGIVRFPEQCPDSGITRMKCVRPSYKEAIHHFITVLPEGTNIETFCKEQQPFSQPFVVVIGAAVNPSECFVIVGKRSVRCNSLLCAVDVCFKAHHLLNLKYPRFVKNTFLFLEKSFYKLKSSTTIPTCVFEIEQELL